MILYQKKHCRAWVDNLYLSLQHLQLVTLASPRRQQCEHPAKIIDRVRRIRAGERFPDLGNKVGAATTSPYPARRFPVQMSHTPQNDASKTLTCPNGHRGPRMLLLSTAVEEKTRLICC